MSEPSSIYLTNRELVSKEGTAINLADYGLISTSSITSTDAEITPATNIFNYNQLTPSTLLNGNFDSGDFTDWLTNAGNIDVIESDFPGLTYSAQINNLGAIWQVVEGFEGNHPVLTFFHKGPEIICTLELNDVSDALISIQNKIFRQSDIWVRCTMGYYSGNPDAVKAQCTFFSVNDGVEITKISLQVVPDFAGVTIGDEYLTTRDSVSISAKKLFVGGNDQLISARPEKLDIRGSAFILDDLTVLGSIFSGPIFPSIGSQTWVTNIIASSGSQTQINFTSGLIQTISGDVYTISSTNTGVMTLTTYVYLDINISISELQFSTTYTDVIDPDKLFFGIAVPGTSGNASFTSMSNQQPLINGSTQISAASIVNNNLAINSVQAQNIDVINLAAIKAEIGNLTLSEVDSSIAIGTTPPISPTLGTGLFINENGVYSLDSNIQQATLTNLGLSAGNNAVIANVSGLHLTAPEFPDATYVDWITDDTEVSVGSILGWYVSSASGVYILGKGKSISHFGVAGLAAMDYNQDLGDYKVLFDIDTNGQADLDFREISGTSGGQYLNILTKITQTDSLNTVLRLSTVSTGTTQSGLGSSVAFFSKNSIGTDQNIGYMGIRYFDPANGSEDSTVIFGVLIGGVLTEIASIASNGIGIGTMTPNTSSILELSSTTKAFLPTRMTTTQRDNIVSPVAGMVIYNTTTSKLNLYTSSWREVTSS